MFQPVITRLGIRYISRRLLQSLLFVLGVALGVAIVVAVDTANASASRAFELSTQSVFGNATHQIESGSQGVPTDVYRQIRLDFDLEASAPVVTEFVRARGLEKPLQILGVDPFVEPPFREYLNTVEIEGEEAGDAFDAFVRLIAEPGSVLMTDTLAGELDIQPGDDLTLRLPQGGDRAMTLVGVLRAEDSLSRQALRNLLLMDIASAQELLDLPNHVTRIDLIIEDDVAETLAAIQAILPENVQITSAADESGAIEELTAAFEINLQALSLLAVVVGIFLIYNTVTFSVVQRRPVIGVLRSVGATRRQIFAFILGEATLLGLIGTVFGLGLGIIFGRFTVGLVSQTISDLYFNVTVNTVSISVWTLLKGVAIGIFASIGAAIVPSIDATRTPPTGSMQRSSFEEKIAELIPYITVAAIVFFIAGLLLLQIPTTSLYVSFGALFAIIIGGALFTPAVLILSMRGVVPLTDRLFGVVGRMAPRAIIRSLSRTAVAVAALTIAVSVIIGVSVMIGSFRSTVGNWLETTLAADIFVSAPSLTANLASTPLDPQIRELVANTEGVERVSASRSVTVPAPDYPNLPDVNLSVVDFDLAGSARDFVWVRTDDPRAALESGQIMVSEPFAFRRGITRENDTLTLLTDEGPQTFEIFGVFYDYSTDQGTVFMKRAVYDQYWDDSAISAVAAYLAPEADLETVLNRLESDVLADYDLTVQSNLSLRENVFAIFDQTFQITIALRLLATVVAFIGILSALLSLQLEHTREYGVMRANGMTPNQLRGFTFIQTGLMGIVAGLLAIPIGLVLALVLIYVINVRSFGWTMQFTILYGEIGQAFLIAILAALIAGVYPAYQLSRMNIARAVRSE